MKFRNRTIPDAGKQLRSWVHTFSRQIDQDPHRFGLTADDAALIMAEANNYTSGRDPCGTAGHADENDRAGAK